MTAQETIDQLAKALRELLAMETVCSRPIGAPHSPARLHWEDQRAAVERAKEVLRMVGH